MPVSCLDHVPRHMVLARHAPLQMGYLCLGARVVADACKYGSRSPTLSMTVLCNRQCKGEVLPAAFRLSER